MKHYSPSFVGKIALCARCTPDDDGPANEAADNGTLFHDDLYHTIGDHRPNEYESFVAGLSRSDDHKDMVRRALAEVSVYTCLGLPVVKDFAFRYADGISHIEPGIYLECSVELWPDDRKHKVGRIDMLVVPNVGHAIIVDYKSNRTDTDFSYQLDSYACALKRICKEPWKQVIGKIVAPNLDEHEDIVYDPKAIEAAERTILGIEERANNPFSPPCPGESQCKYCRCNRLGQCPALVRSSSSGVPESGKVPKAIVVEKDTDALAYDRAVAVAVNRPALVLKPTTLQERADRRDWMSVASMLIDYIKADDKAYFQKPEHSGESLPGYSVSTRDGNRQVDRTRLKELNRKLIDSFGLGYDIILSCLEPVKELLVERLAVTLGTRTAAEERYSEVVDEFTVRGAPITTVRRESARKLMKLKVTEKQQ